MVKELAVPLAFCAFAFGSPLRAAWSKIASPRSGGEPPPSLPIGGPDPDHETEAGGRTAV
jgi:hypothetical protein